MEGWGLCRGEQYPASLPGTKQSLIKQIKGAQIILNDICQVENINLRYLYSL